MNEALAALHHPGAGRPQVHRGVAGASCPSPVDYVEDLIRRWQLGPPQVRLIGAPDLDPRWFFATSARPDGSIRSTLRHGGLGQLLGSAGCTVVVNRWHLFDESPLDLVDRVTARRGTEATGNLYLAGGASRSFGPHWDGHDVLAIQLAGRKTWTFFGCDVEDATARVPQGRPPSTPQLQIELEPGDALLVPRGWWHEATCDDTSLHVSIAGPPLTVADLLARSIARLEPEQPALRRDVLVPTTGGGLALDAARVLDALALLERLATHEPDPDRTGG